MYFTLTASRLNSQFLLNMDDNYVIHTGIDCIDDPNNHVLVMERINASLSQIINYRRANNWDWSIQEFHRFLWDLVSGLSDLHSAGISHNDIRPANVYFSVKKNCYLIGNYANCQKG